MKDIPDLKDVDSIGSVMTNYNHEILPYAETLLRDGKWGDYSGWNFYGQYVWFADEQFHCAVYRYGSLESIESAKSLEELMKVVSNIYGQD